MLYKRQFVTERDRAILMLKSSRTIKEFMHVDEMGVVMEHSAAKV